MKTKFAILMLFLLLGFVHSDGVIIPIHHEDQYPLILNHYVTVTINDTYARTRVEQEFRNDGYRDLEGVYMFPVPGGGVRDVKLIVDGKTLEGTLLGSEEAKKTYQQYVLERRDASLLEYVGRDAFSSSIVLPRGKTVKVVITYEQIISSSAGLYTYMYPLSPERYSTKPIDPVNITININAPGTLGFIYSPTHNITVQRGETGKAVVSYYEEKVLPDKDFQLYYGVSNRDYDVKLLAQKSNESGYFLLFIYPSIVNQTTIPKDVVFVIDTSGSMEGTKLDQVKSALKYGLDRLNGEDRFNIISFSSTTKRYADTLQSVSSVQGAKNFVDGMSAEGATDLQDPLAQSIAWFQNDSRMHLVIILTDGRDTTGHSNTDILKALTGSADGSGKNFKLFVFGVGEDVDFELLDKLSNEFGDGIATYIKNEADLEMTLKSFYDRVSTPVLSDVRLTITPSSAPVVCEMGSTACVGVEGAVSTYDLLPKRIPDIFLGTQLVVAGRYSGYGDATVRLKGSVGGVQKELKYDVSFPQTSSNSFVERTWALRKVGYLLDQITLDGETPELKQQVTELAVKYGIPTPYTSYLVKSPEGNEIRRNMDIAPMAATVAGGSYGVANAYKATSSMAEQTSQAPETKVIGDKTFVSVGGIWEDTGCNGMEPTRNVQFGSQEYLSLISDEKTANYLSVGDNALLCNAGGVVRITPASTGQTPPQNANQQSPPATGTEPSNSNLIVPVAVVLVLFTIFVVLSMLRRAPAQKEPGDADVYRALSSGTRMEILNTLLEGERTPTDISSKLNKSKATIVEHLDKLREADLVEKIEVDGRKWVFYKLTPRGKSIIKKGG